MLRENPLPVRSPSPIRIRSPRHFPFSRAALNYPRYKVVVQVVLGQNKHQGVKIASRCLWDTETDNYASFSYTNVS